MPLMNDLLAVGALSVGQQTGLKSIKLERTYDLVLAALSWERRATTGLAATLGLSGRMVLMKFASSSLETDRAKEAAFVQFQKMYIAERLDLDVSTNFAKNANRIESFIQDLSVHAKRPLKVLLDITCIPKSYLLFILGLGFSRNYVSRLDCIYAEGAYALAEFSDEPAGGAKARGIISEGEWESLQVPYLGAERAIPNARDLLVAMGGEIGLSLPFIEKYEPVKLGLVLIKESLVQTPDKLLASEAAALSELLSEPNVARKDIGLCDVVSFVREASKFCSESKVDAVSGIVLGAKTHALALGIVALSQENLEIVCRIPKRYRPLNVAPTGDLAFFQIEDRFEPSAYL
jgi:hypothetical protein